MILQVHDELRVRGAREREIAAVTALVREEMEGVAASTCRCVVDVGTGENWREAH